MSQLKGFTLFLLLILFGMISAGSQPCFSDSDYNRTYSLETDGATCTLTLAVPESLYDTYLSRSHLQTTEKFVTPQVFSQVASEIRESFADDESFANAVLMITHEIPQPQGNVNLKYPVQTIVENIGDCDVFSVLAASVMKAGGLDVVLLEYPGHMNLGVYLQHEPTNVRTGEIVWYPYNGKNYYVAETTGGLSETPWRVGEDPGEYSRATVTSLGNYDNSSPGQVTATLMLAQPFLPTPPGGISPLSYIPLGLACMAAIGWFFYRLMPRRTRQSTESRSYEKDKKNASTTEKLPYGVWCVCPSCGAYISANIEYCSCGFKLPRRSEASLSVRRTENSRLTNSQTATKLPEGYWCACPKCGAYIGIDTQHCPFCKARLPYRQYRNQ